jgi:hypothetical protein
MAEMKTSSSICEPPDKRDSLVQVDDGLCLLNQRYATEQFYVAECDLGLGVLANPRSTRRAATRRRSSN